MVSVQRVASLSDLPPGTMKRVRVQGREVLLVHTTTNDLLAFSGECTHAGGPLDEGTLGEYTVECPWHGSKFSLDTGDSISGPAMQPLSRYKVIVQDEDIMVDVTSPPR